jgi:membrane protein DedA with SNARE-associated domain
LPNAPALLDLITVHGPWLLFLLAILETSFVTGLIVPSGVATSLATAVALERGGSLFYVGLAAAVGGAIGDTAGFWIGRAGRARWQDGTSGFALQVRQIRAQASRWFGGHPFVSVTIARLISFVRTVMPMIAGMSDLGYRRFLGYDIPGVIVWVALYMTAGAAAGRGWSWATDAFGMGGALTVAGIVAGAVWLVRRRRAAAPTGGRSA